MAEALGQPLMKGVAAELAKKGWRATTGGWRGVVEVGRVMNVPALSFTIDRQVLGARKFCFRAPRH
jgi:hypothetical protein